MARGYSSAMSESERVLKGKKVQPSDPAYEPVAMDGDLVIRKGGFKAPSLQDDVKFDKKDAESGMKYLRTNQNITDNSESTTLKGGDPMWKIPASKEAPRQRWLEIADESIRSTLKQAGFKDWANVEGVGPNRLMAPWMLSSKFWDFSGKTPVQIAPIPKKFER